MKTLDRLQTLLPADASRAIAGRADQLTEVRVRIDRPVQLRGAGMDLLAGEPVPADVFGALLASLMDHSVYAREDELRQGFFTMPDGCRVGVCGRLVCDGDRAAGMAEVRSICVRLCREVRGCAGKLLEHVASSGRVRSTLIVSPPGMGKTTMLRELARVLSESGHSVCVSDERRELAACRDGVPGMDLGPRTDVMDGSPKHIAIRQMTRSMAPDVIVADEIGDPRDAEALADASRCGASVISSAHGSSLDAVSRRAGIAEIIECGIFELGALLSGAPGNVVEVREF